MSRKILRILGSRYGIAAILLVVVIIVVGLARANGGTDSDTTVDGSDSMGTEDAGEPNDGVVTESDEESAESSLPKKAVDNATEFAKAYIKTDRSAKAWRADVGKNATQKVKDELKYIDPEVVPIKEITDDPSAEGQTVRFPTDAGLLILRMKVQDEVWLVDGIDLDKS
ncbi:hypothetical protein [Stackebrandtia nassauensis]|uniref:Uncharacterized protein n=1 Tax=Stackebrandtia nassauensis (strain DSM 44728 / CIP 108903 / NRRL B-16338 / NBRC 102104 / LLR-40K-21) TaxID=446470 RepID=D3Q5Q2_STANL|nr:hypothetical protein [Stackebrandtia nassauensis]ADD40201.1 hypothetical protein Snas_0486 [Stackebrandtia nassauensis DSM 44728]